MRPDERPCPFCGGTAYVWGDLRAQNLRFLPQGAGWLDATFGGGWGLRARRCETCANVQLFDAALGHVGPEEGSLARVSRVVAASPGTPPEIQLARTSESVAPGPWTMPFDAWLVARSGEEAGFLLTGGTMVQSAGSGTYRRFDAREVQVLAERLVGAVEDSEAAFDEPEARRLLRLLVELVMGAADAADEILVELR